MANPSTHALKASDGLKGHSRVRVATPVSRFPKFSSNSFGTWQNQEIMGATMSSDNRARPEL
jgi:hypothetical protein